MQVNIDFEWFPGLSISQKQRSIQALHEAAAHELGLGLIDILEVSTKAPSTLGTSLSALNLGLELRSGRVIPVEVAFQSAKVFRDAGEQSALLALDLGRDAKLAIRALGDDPLVGFAFEGTLWPLEPDPNIYDFLYLRALVENHGVAEELLRYRAFSDIEFNPRRSLNCQARSCAYFVSLGAERAAKVTKSPGDFQAWAAELRPTTPQLF